MTASLSDSSSLSDSCPEELLLRAISSDRPPFFWPRENFRSHSEPPAADWDVVSFGLVVVGADWAVEIIVRPTVVASTVVSVLTVTRLGEGLDHGRDCATDEEESDERCIGIGVVVVFLSRYAVDVLIDERDTIVVVVDVVIFVGEGVNVPPRITVGGGLRSNDNVGPTTFLPTFSTWFIQSG